MPRPRITVTNWLTGRYVVGDASSEPRVTKAGRSRARAQVVAARRRAGARRFQARGDIWYAHRRTSTTLKLLVMSGIACIVAFAIAFALTGFDVSNPAESIRSTLAGIPFGREEATVREEIEQAVSELMERGAIEVSYHADDIDRAIEMNDSVPAPPKPVGSGRLVVIDDRTSFAATDGDPDAVLESFTGAGWRIETDPQLAAQASVAMFRCRTWASDAGGGSADRDIKAEQFACQALDSFRADQDVEAVLLMLTADAEQGAHSVRTRLVLIGDESIDVALRTSYHVDVEGLWPDGRREMITVEIGGGVVGDDTATRVDPDGGRSTDDAEMPGEAFRIPGVDWEFGDNLDVHAGPVRIRIAA